MLKMESRRFFAISVSLVICLVWLVTLPVDSMGQAKLEKKTIKIGYAGGINFVFGKQMLQSLQDAAEEVNSAGGVLGSKLEVASADTGLTAAGASSAISKVVFWLDATLRNV